MVAYASLTYVTATQTRTNLQLTSTLTPSERAERVEKLQLLEFQIRNRYRGLLLYGVLELLLAAKFGNAGIGFCIALAVLFAKSHRTLKNNWGGLISICGVKIPGLQVGQGLSFLYLPSPVVTLLDTDLGDQALEILLLSVQAKDDKPVRGKCKITWKIVDIYKASSLSHATTASSAAEAKEKLEKEAKERYNMELTHNGESRLIQDVESRLANTANAAFRKFANNFGHMKLPKLDDDAELYLWLELTSRTPTGRVPTGDQPAVRHIYLEKEYGLRIKLIEISEIQPSDQSVKAKQDAYTMEQFGEGARKMCAKAAGMRTAKEMKTFKPDPKAVMDDALVHGKQATRETKVVRGQHDGNLGSAIGTFLTGMFGKK